MFTIETHSRFDAAVVQDDPLKPRDEEVSSFRFGLVGVG